jgi:hypothetical protein
MPCKFEVNLITRLGLNMMKEAIVANQKQELPLAAIFVGGTERNGETL